MRVTRHMLRWMIGWLIAMAAVATLGVTLIVYSGQGRRETVTAIAREFFRATWKASQVRPAQLTANPNATPEGGTIR